MPIKPHWPVLALGLMIAGCATHATDLRIDAEPDQALRESVVFTDVEQGKADALTSFALGLVSQKPDEAVQLLLKSLSKDPNAELPLRLLLNQISSTSQAGIIAKALAELGAAHPEALRVNLAAVLLLKGQNNQLAEELAEKALDVARQSKKLTAVEHKAVASLAGTLASIYAMDEKKISRGDRLLEEYLADDAFRNNYYLLEAAVLFYHKAAKNADPTPFLWFWESDKERFTACKQELLERVKNEFANPAEREIFASIAGMYEILEMPDEVERLLLTRIMVEPANPVLFTALAGYYYKNRSYAKSMLWWRAARNRFKLQDDSLLAYAEAAFHARYFNEALQAYQRYSVAYPQQNVPKLMLALSCMEVGQNEFAARVLRTMPDSFMVLKLRGMAEDRLGNVKVALELMQQAENAAERTAPQAPDAIFYLYLMMLTEKNRQVDLTLRYAELVEKKFGTSEPVIANAIGYTYADLNVQFEPSETLIRFAISKEPDKAEYFDSLAWVQFRRGLTKIALATMMIALEKQGKFPNSVIAEHAGDIYHALGNDAEAAKYWRLALLIYSREINRKNLETKLAAINAKEKK